MRHVGRRAVLLGALVGLPVAFSATAAELVLYSFAGGSDGATPTGTLARDAAGNLYGITNSGGNSGCASSLSLGCGTVFELTQAAGGWREQVLHVFAQATEGGVPLAAPVIDAVGDLFGSTEYYGAHGAGSVWQLVPAAGGTWTANVLHSFTGGGDGFDCTGLAFDGGMLYGVTYAGGTHGDGTVFRLAPRAGGGWNELVVHDFAGGDVDGNAPAAAPTFASADRAFGTTYEGGPHFTGTVYELTHTAAGVAETPIYVFAGLPFGSGADGTNPTAGVIVGRGGHLFGTTDYGGAAGVGTVYELTPDGSGGWSEAVIYSFTDRADGGHPGGLVTDAAGNLYGLTTGHDTAGSVFRLSPSSTGGWTFTLLHAFTGGADGGYPSGSLVLDAEGNLYGTAAYGGAHGNGVVFEIPAR
jgi:uncharacterized repeat protein (TIGR03803 family)